MADYSWLPEAIVVAVTIGLVWHLKKYIEKTAENLATTESAKLIGYLTERGKNLATKDDIQAISYLSEKGKNIATKQDIKDITDTIEKVKTEYVKEVEALRSELGYVTQQRIALRQKEREVIFTLLEDTCLLLHDKLSSDAFKQPYMSDEEFQKYRRDVNSLMTKVEIDCIKLAAYFPDNHALRNSATEMRNALGEVLTTFNAKFDWTARCVSVLGYAQGVGAEGEALHGIDSEELKKASGAVAEFSTALNDIKKPLYGKVKAFQDAVRDYFQVDELPSSNTTPALPQALDQTPSEQQPQPPAS